MLVCVAGRVVRITWKEIQFVEQRKLLEKYQREKNELEELLASTNAALEMMRNSERQRTEEVKAKNVKASNEMAKLKAEHRRELDELKAENERLAAELAQLKGRSDSAAGETPALPRVERHKGVNELPDLEYKRHGEKRRPEVELPVGANFSFLPYNGRIL